MTEFLSAAAVAGLGGLFWLAYNHPAPAKTLTLALGMLSLAFIAGCIIWEIAANRVFVAIIPLIKEGQLSAAQSLVDQNKPPYWPVVGVLAANIVLMFAVDKIGNLKGDGKDEEE